MAGGQQRGRRPGERPERTSSGPRSIAEGLSGIVAGLNPHLVVLGRAWEAAVGAGVARHAMPVRQDDEGVLHVSCDSSAWSAEVQARESEVLERLAEQGVEGLTGLRCRVHSR